LTELRQGHKPSNLKMEAEPLSAAPVSTNELANYPNTKTVI